jgi:hypothetical protein
MTLASVLVATVWLRFGSQNFWATGRRRDLQWVPCDTRELLFVQFVGNILVKSLRSHLAKFHLVSALQQFRGAPHFHG